MVGAMSKPQGGLAGAGVAADNCEFLKGKKYFIIWYSLLAFFVLGFTASGERIPDCLPKERIEPPIGSYSCCCIEGDQCPNPFEDRTPIVPSDNPFAENEPSDNPFGENENEVEYDEYGGLGVKSGGSSRPVPLQPPPVPIVAPETCPGSDAKACCYNDKEIGM